MDDKENKNVNPFEDSNYSESNPQKKVMIAFLVVGAIALVFLTITNGGNDFSVFSNTSNKASSQSASMTPGKHCTDEFGRPRESACRKALRSKGYNVDKYTSWGGSDNGGNSVICTATDRSGFISGFEVVFDSKCNGISVKLVDF